MPRQTSQPDLVPVLIVGAGPVGLLLANLLGTRGVPVLLTEQRTEFPDWSRAIGVTPPSLDIMRSLGLDEPLRARGVAVKQARVHGDRGLVGTVDFSTIDSAFHHILAVPQCDTIEVLADSLTRFSSVSWRRGWKLVALRRATDHVVAEFETHGGNCRETVNARWVVGCDGSDSSVRQFSEVSFNRGPYAPRFVMADYDDTTDLGPYAHLYFTRHGSVESFPLPAYRRRWVVLANDMPANGTPASFLEDKVAERTGQSLAHSVNRSPVFEFTPEFIIVDRMTIDPILLAGDAAHVMTPIGGHGMNTGLADAELAAALLLRVLAGERPSPLLAAYNGCRQRAARSARRRAAFGMWVGTRTGTVSSTLRNLALRGLLTSPLGRGIPSHFAMLNIPCNRACKAPLGEGQR